MQGTIRFDIRQNSQIPHEHIYDTETISWNTANTANTEWKGALGGNNTRRDCSHRARMGKDLRVGKP